MKRGVRATPISLATSIVTITNPAAVSPTPPANSIHPPLFDF
jgi:hypothetical protein